MTVLGSGIFNSISFEVCYYITNRNLRIGVVEINLIQNICLLWTSNVSGGSFAKNRIWFQLKCVGDTTTHIEAFLTTGMISIRYALLYGFSLQLGKNDADTQHGTAHRR